MERRNREDEYEPPVSLDHFKIIIDVLDGNSNGYDVELLYKVYAALMDGTEEDLEKANRTLEFNREYETIRSFN